MKFIGRDYDRTEEDDFKLNVQPRMGKGDGATPQRDDKGKVFGWVVKPMYE